MQQRKRYSEEFKREAVGLTRLPGASVSQIARDLGNGVVLVDDSYNANPASLDAAMDALVAAAGEGWLVLGDMRELGEQDGELHAQAGRRACASGITRLYALGELSGMAAAAFGEGARVFDSHAALADALRIDLQKYVETRAAGQAALRVLVKGSRGSAMDRIVVALLSAREKTSHAA